MYVLHQASNVVIKRPTVFIMHSVINMPENFEKGIISMKHIFLLSFLIATFIGFKGFAFDSINLDDGYKSKPIVKKLQRKKNEVLNLSGITYVPNLDIYYAIENAQVKGNSIENEARIFVFSKKLLGNNNEDDFLSDNVIKLEDFSSQSSNDNPGSQCDFEDIVFIDMVEGLPRFALINETGEIYVGVIDPSRKGNLLSENFKKIIFNDGTDLDRKIKNNKGPEGVAFDPHTQTIFVVNEGTGMRVEAFKLPVLEDLKEINISSRVRILDKITQTLLHQDKDNALPIKDMAGVVFNQKTGRLLILSDESQVIYDISLKGTLYAVKQLTDEKLHPEGITIDGDESLVVVSEPNLVLKYKLKN